MTKKAQKSNKFNFNILLILVLPILLYANTLFHDFAYDDFDVIVENSKIQEGLSSIPNLFLNVQTFENKTRVIYRPLSYSSHAIEYTFFGASSFVGHLMNILYYALCCLLVYIGLIRLLGEENKAYALAISLFFIVHPLHTESVANIKGRDDILCLLFFICSLISYLKYLDSKKFIHIVGLVFCFALSFFSKETAITFLPVIFLVGLFKSQNLKKLWLKDVAFPTFLCAIIPFCVLAIIFLIGDLNTEDLYAFQDNPIVGTSSFSEKIATTIWVWGYYLKKICFPFPLLYYYGFKQIELVNFTNIQVWITLFVTIGILYYVLKNLKHRNYIVFGCLFFAFTFSIYAHIVPGAAIIAERYMFSPLLGIAIALVFIKKELDKNQSSWWKKINSIKVLKFDLSTILYGIVLLIFSIITIDRNRDWKDNLTLFSNDISYLSEATKAQSNLGVTLMGIENENKKKEGIKHLQKALQIYKSSFNHRALGQAYLNVGSPEKAINELDNALKENAKNKKAHLNKGFAHYDLKEFEKATFHIAQSIDLGFDNEQAYSTIARAYCRKSDVNNDDMNKAFYYLEKGEIKYPKSFDILADKGRVSILKQDFKTAIATFKSLESQYPNKRGVIEGLFKAYSGIGNQEQSLLYRNKLNSM